MSRFDPPEPGPYESPMHEPFWTTHLLPPVLPPDYACGPASCAGLPTVALGLEVWKAAVTHLGSAHHTSTLRCSNTVLAPHILRGAQQRRIGAGREAHLTGFNTRRMWAGSNLPH